MLAEQVLPRGEEWVRQTVARLAALGAGLGTVDVPLARGHGDLGPSNVVVAPRWAGSSIGRVPAPIPVLNDVLTFLHHYAGATPRRGMAS